VLLSASLNDRVGHKTEIEMKGRKWGLVAYLASPI
jgi:hypothetical protein